MEQIELYKGFRIRAHEERPGRWLAEARKAGIDSDADWIAKRPPVTQRQKPLLIS
jgi:hypothetical protein